MTPSLLTGSLAPSSAENTSTGLPTELPTGSSQIGGGIADQGVSDSIDNEGKFSNILQKVSSKTSADTLSNDEANLINQAASALPGDTVLATRNRAGGTVTLPDGAGPGTESALTDPLGQPLSEVGGQAHLAVGVSGGQSPGGAAVSGFSEIGADTVAQSGSLDQYKLDNKQNVAEGTLPSLTAPTGKLEPISSGVTTGGVGGGVSPQSGKSLPGSVAYPSQVLGNALFSKEISQPLLATDSYSAGAASAKLGEGGYSSVFPITPGKIPGLELPVSAGNAVKPSIVESVTSSISQSLTTAAITEGAQTELDSMFSEAYRTLSPQSAVDRTSITQLTMPTMSLPRPAGTPGWDVGLGQRMLWMVDNGLNQVELRLDPPNLGTVNVRIAMTDDQAQLVFQTSNQAAREALEQALPRLREMFSQHGLALDSADISDHGQPTRDGEESLEGQSNRSDRTHQALADEAAENGISRANLSVNSIRQSDGIIDEFV